MTPDLRPVCRKPDASVGAHIALIRFLRSEILKGAGPDLFQPDMERTVAVGQKGDESSIGGDRRIQLTALEVGEGRELRIDQQVLDGRRRLAHAPACRGDQQTQQDDSGSRGRAPATW